MTDNRINTAVALLRARDETIAAQAVTIANQAATIRHLKTLLAEQDAEIANRERAFNDTFFDE